MAGRARHGYHLWKSMVRRCHDPRCTAFKWYGARGITVHLRWHDMDTFMREFGNTWPGKGWSIERIDNDRGYEPGNVKWATPIEQANNKRRVVKHAAFGKALSVTEWQRETGIPASAIRRRLELGWSIEKAVTHPVRTLVYTTRPGRRPIQRSQ